MKSFSKIHSPVSSSRLETWNIADLEVESNVLPPQNEIEEIMSLFGVGTQDQPGKSGHALDLTLHPEEWEPELENWSPGDLDLPMADEEPAQWEFVNRSNEFVEISDPQIVQEKPEAEKERIELINRAQAEADEILQAARCEADKMVQHAWEEIDQAKTKAYQAAYQEMQGALATTRAMVDETRKWQTSFMESGEQVLAGMLKEMAQTMFGEGVNLDANALQVNLNRVMESAQRLGDLNIFLNPQDANLLDPSWSDYQLLITGNKVRIVPSEKILPGGCFIKGSTGSVDARVETQLAAVLNTIDEIRGMGR